MGAKSFNTVVRVMCLIDSVTVSREQRDDWYGHTSFCTEVIYL